MVADPSLKRWAWERAPSRSGMVAEDPHDHRIKAAERIAAWVRSDTIRAHAEYRQWAFDQTPASDGVDRRFAEAARLLRWVYPPAVPKEVR